MLDVKNITKTFGKANTLVTAVDNISFNINAGEMVMIMGPSGSGKTTLLSMIGGLLRPTSGSIVIDGVDICQASESELPTIRALKIGFVFQSFNLLDALTVEENIVLPSILKKSDKEKSTNLANDLIVRLGLSDRRHALPKTLSGGEKQRVAIARALINEPGLILADEPTGNLDSKTGQDVMMILHDLVRDQGYAVVLVTHDPRVEEIADRVLWIEDGRLTDRTKQSQHWVRDPVCGMRVETSLQEFVHEFDGTVYHFCSEKCQQRFSNDPGKYIFC